MRRSSHSQRHHTCRQEHKPPRGIDMAQKINAEELQKQHQIKERYFATIREELQKPPSSPGWEIIKNHVRYCIKKESWSYDEPIQKFKSQYLPYIVQALESWPDDIKLVHFHELGEVYDLGRIAIVTASDKQSKKDIKSYAKTLQLAPSLNGIFVNNISKYLIEHVEGYCNALSQPLKHLYVNPSIAYSYSELKRGQFREDGVREMVHWIIDHHGHNLETLGLQLSNAHENRAATDALWQPVLERSEELPNLRHLIVGQAQGTHKNWGKEILETPAFDTLDTLAEIDLFYRLPYTAILERTASKNLKRLKLYELTNTQCETFIKHDNLQNLEAMELHTSGYPALNTGWHTQTSEHWEYERQKLLGDDSQPARHPYLNTTQIRIENATIKELHEVFLDSDNNLVPSDRVETISITNTSDTLTKALLTQAHIAYPNLQQLELSYPIFFSPEEYRDLLQPGHVLLDKLEQFSLYPRFTGDYLGYPEEKAQFDEISESWLELAMDDTLHPKLRYWAWMTYRREGPISVPFLKKRLNQLGIKYTSKMKADELKQLLKDAIPPEIKSENYY